MENTSTHLWAVGRVTGRSELIGSTVGHITDALEEMKMLEKNGIYDFAQLLIEKLDQESMKNKAEGVKLTEEMIRHSKEFSLTEDNIKQLKEYMHSTSERPQSGKRFTILEGGKA
ncbi:hypothetical protein ACFOU0_12385 [Salinicoccus sesuvii]|uniref:Uncharacterized protein n=1 Tax=Salinicoccus sesuvii TaxID=868281 RepID=A0ABV7N724_9STAP